MRELFPGFYYNYPTGIERSKLWQDAIFVLDTNMLLNIYRYSPETRDRYFEILNRLEKQLWIPYQVIYEYQDNREAVIREQGDAYERVVNILETSLKKLNHTLEPYENKHSFINPIVLTEKIKREVERAKSIVREIKKQNKNEHTDLIKDDKLRDQLEKLLKGRVGFPYLKDKLQSVYKQAELRMELEVPPGWKDDTAGIEIVFSIILQNRTKGSLCLRTRKTITHQSRHRQV
jgi:PIN like domain